MKTVLPAFVFWLCGGSAILLITLALPLWRRRVPPNALYGARFPATLGSSEVWYHVNALAGRDLVLIATGYLAAICALATRPAWRQPVPLLVATAAFVVALIASTVRLSRLADRLSRQTVH